MHNIVCFQCVLTMQGMCGVLYVFFQLNNGRILWLHIFFALVSMMSFICKYIHSFLKLFIFMLTQIYLFISLSGSDNRNVQGSAGLNWKKKGQSIGQCILEPMRVTH